MTNPGGVSVVLPFLNAERFLGEAIESVLAQTHHDWQLVLVDDGSSDGSTEIAAKYAAFDPARISYVTHLDGRTHGLSASRNLGIIHLDAEYVAFLDADDVWLPHKLEQQVAVLARTPDVGMLYGPYQNWYSWRGRPGDDERDYVEPVGVPVDVILQPPSLMRPYFILQSAAIPSMSNVIVRRRTIEDVGGFDEVDAYEDQAFYAKIILKFPVIASNECWDRYRQHEDSLTARVQKRGEAESARARFFEWLIDYLSREGFADDADLLKALRRQRRRHAYPRLARIRGLVAPGA